MTGDGGSVEVDIDGLQSYSRELFKLAGAAPGSVTDNVRKMGLKTAEAFASNSGRAGVFSEGRLIQQSLAQHASDFQAFAADLAKGLLYISNAAAVIAASYHGADAESKAQINDVDFAFGDTGAKRPDRLASGVGKTFSQEEYELRQQAAPICDALRPDGVVVSGDDLNYDGNGYKFIQVYADGSYQIITGTYANGNRTTTTVVYSAADKPLRTTAQTTDPNGNVVAQSQRAGDGSSPTAGDVSTEIVTDGGQRKVVTTTTEAGPGGKLTVNRVETPIDPNHHRDATNPGPVESEEERLNRRLPPNYVAPVAPVDQDPAAAV